MKKVVGTLIVLLSLIFLAIVVLRIWGIHIVSLDKMIRSSLTLLIVGVFIIFFIIVYGAFYKNNRAGYNAKIGNRAHPKV